MYDTICNLCMKSSTFMAMVSVTISGSVTRKQRYVLATIREKRTPKKGHYSAILVNSILLRHRSNLSAPVHLAEHVCLLLLTRSLAIRRGRPYLSAAHFIFMGSVCEMNGPGILCGYSDECVEQQ